MVSAAQGCAGHAGRRLSGQCEGRGLCAGWRGIYRPVALAEATAACRCRRAEPSRQVGLQLGAWLGAWGARVVHGAEKGIFFSQTKTLSLCHIHQDASNKGPTIVQET